jgi:hypothetical protein
MSDNPYGLEAIRRDGTAVSKWLPLIVSPTAENAKHNATKVAPLSRRFEDDPR